MPGRHEHRERRTIDALLSGAEVLAEDYDERDVAAVRERVLAEPDGPGRGGASTPFGEAAVGAAADAADATAAPARHYPTECEQAAHDLDLAVSLVVNAPEAAASLERLVDDQQAIAPEGALVFGCLLHLARYREAAQFWWQFAAGGGSRTAAFCLCLHHRRHGEFRDADYWRAQSSRLGQHARKPGSASGGAAGGATGGTAGGAAVCTPGNGAAGNRVANKRPCTRPLLPDGVRHGLLSECRGGGAPRLPHALEAVIHRLPVLDDDEDFGEIPQPAGDLTGHLTTP